MTTGEYLLSRSSLPSGTALAHLLAIQAGSGQGTVFASHFSVQIDTPSLVVSRKVKRTVQSEARTAPVVQPKPAKPQKNVAVLTTTPSAVAFTAPDEITVLQRGTSVVATTRLASESSLNTTRKHQIFTLESIEFIRQ